MTLKEFERLLQAQHQPQTVDALCQLASATALVSIALNIDTLSDHLWNASIHLGSISERIDSLVEDLDRIERSLSKIEKKYQSEAE